MKYKPDLDLDSSRIHDAPGGQTVTSSSSSAAAAAAATPSRLYGL